MEANATFLEEFRSGQRQRWKIVKPMRDKVIYSVAMLGAVVMVRNLYLIFMVAPDEASQGMIYRLLYFHVPAWWTAFLAVGLSGVFSLLYLLKRDLRFDSLAASVTGRGRVSGHGDYVGFDLGPYHLRHLVGLGPTTQPARLRQSRPISTRSWQTRRPLPKICRIPWTIPIGTSKR